MLTVKPIIVQKNNKYPHKYVVSGSWSEISVVNRRVWCGVLGAFCGRKLLEDPAPRFEDVDAVESRRRRMMAAVLVGS